MDYLCLAVKKEATRSQTGSREQAQKRFFEKFGDCVKVKLEEEKKKLEGRIRYYDRKGENSKGKPEEKEEWLRRREAAQREMECVERQLEGEQQLQVWSYEDKYECCDEIFDSPVFDESVLMLSMAKICPVGSGFEIVEERYSCRVWKESGDKGIAEIRSRIPRDIEGSCILLDICRERPDTAQQFRMKIKRMTTQARRKFRAAKNGGIL